jgi:hypothetical protein
MNLIVLIAVVDTLPLCKVSIRNLKQTGRQRDDDDYSHNDIPDLVRTKWIIKSPTGVRDIVLGLKSPNTTSLTPVGLFHVSCTTQTCQDATSETTNLLSRSVFNQKAFVLISSDWIQFIYTYMHAVNNTQQLFLVIIYLKKFVLAVVVALPSYMLKVPIISLWRAPKSPMCVFLNLHVRSSEFEAAFSWR